MIITSQQKHSSIFLISQMTPACRPVEWTEEVVVVLQGGSFSLTRNWIHWQGKVGVLLTGLYLGASWMTAYSVIARSYLQLLLVLFCGLLLILRSGTVTPSALPQFLETEQWQGLELNTLNSACMHTCMHCTHFCCACSCLCTCDVVNICCGETVRHQLSGTGVQTHHQTANSGLCNECNLLDQLIQIQVPQQVTQQLYTTLQVGDGRVYGINILIILCTVSKHSKASCKHTVLPKKYSKCIFVVIYRRKTTSLTSRGAALLWTVCGACLLFWLIW